MKYIFFDTLDDSYCNIKDRLYRCHDRLTKLSIDRGHWNDRFGKVSIEKRLRKVAIVATDTTVGLDKVPIDSYISL